MMYCNVIHKMAGPEYMETIKFQQDAVHKMGFKATLMLSYDELINPEAISYCKEQNETYGDELGCNLQAIESRAFTDLLGTREMMLHLHTFENQKKIVTIMFEKFKEAFGYYPTSMATYYISSPILTWIKENYPDFKIAVINCLDEGIHMYDGNRHGWNLFCEGSPWGAYYPSKDNSMCPAKNEKDAIGIIGVQHLSRDMIMAHIARDDCFSSHSANVQRGMVNKGKECKYLYDFFEEWQKQESYNDIVYYNTFVGPGWLTDGKNFEETLEDSRDLYCQTLQIYKDNVDKGKLIVCTMSEYADVHMSSCGYDTVDVNHWHDLLYGSKRELFWYCDSNFRMTVDPNLGGAIVDLRPYAGRLRITPGSDTENMWDGSYPYMLHNWHREAYHTCIIGGTDLYEHRTTAEKVEKLKNGEVLLTLKPVEIDIEDDEVSVVSSFLFKKDGSVRIGRKIISSTNPSKEYPLQEKFIGSVGTGVLPQDFRGVQLSVNKGDERLIISTNYEDRIISMEGAESVSAFLPQLNAGITLSPEAKDTCCTAEEGYMFHPYYTLICEHKAVKAGEEAVTWLKIK